jgi:3-methyladenine DNA glycosylase Tag
MVLDAAQDGLGWQTVLLVRENCWRAFDQFDAFKIAKYNRRR